MSRRTLKVEGDTAVTFTDRSGVRYSVRHVGIGHPWHTIGPNGGRVATEAEVALALAVIETAKTEDVRR